VGYKERVKAFFEKPPVHELQPGDLVTCTCHGGIAVVVELFDEPQIPGVAGMNMVRIWWIKKGNTDISRDWLHTINRLYRYKHN
jgi:hypothetical protein